jgi:hypothetical protein
MQTVEARDHRAKPVTISLQEEAAGLEALHRVWAQQVAALRLAHEAAVHNTASILARTDALIAAFEAAEPQK